MKLHRRHRATKSENDREYLIENNTEHEHSKIRRLVWKFAKGTWKAFKVGFKATVDSQSFCIALESTAVATTIIVYQSRKREYRQ